MSTWKEPVGPKGKNVYVRRRLFVLLGLIALVAAVVLVIWQPGSTGGASVPGEVSIPDDLVVADQADQARAAQETPACAAGQLTVTALTDRSSYAPDETPQLSLSVENTGEGACSADLGTAGMSFEVSSGQDQVWRSTDCQKNPDYRAVILEPGVPLETETITWDRTRSSAETCDISRDGVAADGASYHLRATAAGVASTSTAQFLLY